jgi:hypothetical protein
VSSVQAGGFMLYEQSVAGTGRAYAGAGVHRDDDLSAAWYNPAGMTLLDGTQIQFCGTIVFTTMDLHASPMMGGRDNGRKKFVPVPNMYLTHKVNDSWWLGLSLNVPYGMAQEYARGRMMNNWGVNSEMKVFDLSPSIAYKVNEKVTIYDKVNGRDLMRTADKIVELGIELIRKYKYKGSIIIRIDDSGVGGGVTDRLRQIKERSPSRFSWMVIKPIMFGQRIRHIYYHDTTTYMYACMKEMIASVDEKGQPKPVELVLPDDADLFAQLSSRRYEMTEASKIKIESKDDFKKRIGSSPDEADCVIMLCLPVTYKRKHADQ